MAAMVRAAGDANVSFSLQFHDQNGLEAAPALRGQLQNQERRGASG
jgi:hypothetical protein